MRLATWFYVFPFLLLDFVLYLWFVVSSISERTEMWCFYNMGLKSALVIGRLFYPNCDTGDFKSFIFVLVLNEEDFTHYYLLKIPLDG